MGLRLDDLEVVVTGTVGELMVIGLIGYELVLTCKIVKMSIREYLRSSRPHHTCLSKCVASGISGLIMIIRGLQ